MLTRSSSRAGCPWLAILLLLGCLPASAAGSEPPARLTLLTACGGAAPTADESGLLAELELALDGFDVVVVDPGRADFPALAEPEQIEVVRRATSNASDTSPVVWLECGVPEQPAARLLTTDGGIPLVRDVEGDSFAEIALVVRELLGASPPLPVELAPDPDGRPIPESEDEPSPEQPPELEVEVGILSAFELGGGLVGHEGGSFLWGAGIGVDLRLAIGFFGRVILLGKLGPRGEEGEFLILGQRIEPRFELGYLWRLPRFGIGPLVGLSPFVSFIDFAMEDTGHQRDSWWLVRFSAGVDARWQLTERLSLVLDLTVGFMPNKRFYRRSTRETLLKTPTMDLVGLLGVVVTI